MATNIPEPEDLDTAMARGVVRERIAAASNVLGMLAEARKLATLQSLGDKYVDYAFQDLIGDITGQRDALQEALTIAMGLEQQRAPRRASEAMLRRIA